MSNCTLYDWLSTKSVQPITIYRLNSWQRRYADHKPRSTSVSKYTGSASVYLHRDTLARLRRPKYPNAIRSITNLQLQQPSFSTTDRIPELKTMRWLQFISCPINGGSVSLKPAPPAPIPLVTGVYYCAATAAGAGIDVVDGTVAAVGSALTAVIDRQDVSAIRWVKKVGEEIKKDAAKIIIQWSQWRCYLGRAFHLANVVAGVLMYFIHSAVGVNRVSRADNQLLVVGRLEADWAAVRFIPINLQVCCTVKWQF